MDSNVVAGSLVDMMMISSNCNGGSSMFEDDAAREKKRRFSEAQVKSMEVMFEAQAKLESRKKHKLAKELGLQPRQVAIWFQNKRARWKSKELERAYATLSADYDALRSSFDSLLHQKNVLSIQVQRLEEMLEINAHKRQEGADRSVGGGEADQTPILSLLSYTNYSDEEKKLKMPLEVEEIEHRLHKSKEQWGNRSLISDDSEQQQFCFRNTGWTFDQQFTGGGSSQGWEFLPYE